MEATIVTEQSGRMVHNCVSVLDVAENDEGIDVRFMVKGSDNEYIVEYSDDTRWAIFEGWGDITTDSVPKYSSKKIDNVVLKSEDLSEPTPLIEAFDKTSDFSRMLTELSGIRKALDSLVDGQRDFSNDLIKALGK